MHWRATREHALLQARLSFALAAQLNTCRTRCLRQESLLANPRAMRVVRRAERPMAMAGQVDHIDRDDRV